MRRRLPEHLRSHAEWVLAPLGYALVVAFLYYPILGGEVGLGWDTIETYWPDLAFFADQIRSFEFPLWNPYDRGGYPFYADPQGSSLYPVQWLLALVGAALGDTPWWLIQIKMLLHHVLAASLMHLFLRSRGLERSAAVVGGIAWVACAPWLIHKASNVLLPLAWTPLVWLAIDRFSFRPNVRRALLVAGAIYLPGSAGSPPGFFYTALLIAVYGLYRLGAELVRRRQLDPGGGYLGKILPLALLAALVAALPLLVIVIPGLELAELSPRQTRGLAYSLSFPLPVKDTLIGLWVPSAGRVDAYMGVSAMLLATVGLAAYPKRDAGIQIVLAASAAIFLTLSFGGATPILPWLVEHVPGFGLFRAANRFKLPFAVLMSALAGYGASSLVNLGAKLSSESIRAIGALLFSLALIAVLVLKLEPLDPRMEPLSHSLVFAGAASVIMIASTRLGKAAVVAVLTLAALLIVDADHFWHWRGKILEERPDHREDLAVLDSLPGAGRSLRIYDEYQLEQRVGARLALRDFRGYPSGDPLDLQRYRRVLEAIDAKPELLAAYNVGYVLQGSHHRNRNSKNRLKRRPSQVRPRVFARAGRAEIARDPAPWVGWYNSILVVDGASALDAVAVQARQPPSSRLAIIETSDADELGDARARLEAVKTPLSGSGEVVEFEADRVLTSVRLSSPSLVVLNEIDYPGWQVYVDGDKAALVRANYLLRAALVPAGAHLVEWRFEPPAYPFLFGAWVLALLAILLAALSPRGRHWKWRRNLGIR